VVQKLALAKAGLVVALGLLMAGNASGGQIGIGDFSGGETVTTFDGLGLPFINSTPMIFDGNTYTTDDGVLRYTDTFEADCSNECIGNNTEAGYIDVVLGAPAFRVGARVGGGTITYSSLVEFYDVADVLVGSISFGPGDTTLQFAGWEHLGGISRFRLIDTADDNGRITHLEDFRFEGQPIPEPATLLLLGAGLVGLRARRRTR
jgi:hypothetical protein